MPVGGPEREHLPPRLAGRRQPVDETERVVPSRPPGSEVTWSSTPLERSTGNASTCNASTCTRGSRSRMLELLGRRARDIWVTSSRTGYAPSFRGINMSGMPGPDCGEAPPRIVIDDVTPTVGCGRHPVKRSVGDVVQATAVAFTHGHDVVGAAVRYRRRGVRRWSERADDTRRDEPDRFAADFDVTECGRWEFRVVAWVDPIATWREELRRQRRGRPDRPRRGVGVRGPPDGCRVARRRPRLERRRPAVAPRRPTGTRRRSARRSRSTSTPRSARFGSWYELFPRSFGGLAGVEAQLPRLAELGFDVVYLTPIHPIGLTDRKGPDNTLPPRPGDPGSPWAIGAMRRRAHRDPPRARHHRRLRPSRRAAQELGLAIALDFAFQARPITHGSREHPEWFSWLPDGTVQYAENPPKRYEDIVNFDFDSADWRGLWAALLDVVMFWVGHGVRVFRVDNPHTKPVAFWEWLIKEVRSAHPDVIFLSEAFTRPTMLRHLAKIGFNQSYTYFTWRNTRAELKEYVTELAGEESEYLRPNFFVNTPDILHEYLQHGGRARVRGAARARGDALVRRTASTPASSGARTRRCAPGARSTAARRSTRSGRVPSTARCCRSSRASTRSAGRASRSSGSTTCTSSNPTTTSYSCSRSRRAHTP